MYPLKSSIQNLNGKASTFHVTFGNGVRAAA